MPVWGLALLFAAAATACPISMWLIGKVTHRKMDCSMCLPHEDLASLQARREALDAEIAALKGN